MLITPTPSSKLLDGKTAIVAGAGNGIGRPTAEALADIVVADIDGHLAQEVADEIGNNSAAFAGDRTDTSVPDALVEFAIGAGGWIDIIVSSAGDFWDAPLHRMTDEQFQTMIDIHLLAPFRLCHAPAPYFRDAGRGEAKEGTPRYRRIVNVTSLAASCGIPGAVNHAAAKAVLIGPTMMPAREWGPSTVNVNAVAFGVIQEEFGAPQSALQTIVVGGREVALGVPDKMLAARGPAPPEESHWCRAWRRCRPPALLVSPQRNLLCRPSSEHLDRYAATPDQAVAVGVAVKNFAIAALNPNAQRPKARSVEEVPAGPTPAGPLPRVKCCPIGEGAVMVVVVTDDAIDMLGLDRSRCPRVLSSVLRSEELFGTRSFDAQLTRGTATATYEHAGISPQGLDAVEPHDAFTIEELQYVEVTALVDEGTHGGGQTRHSWRRSAQILYHDGYTVATFDARSSGASDWSPPARSACEDLAGDVARVMMQLRERTGMHRSDVVGASVGRAVGSMMTLASDPGVWLRHSCLSMSPLRSKSKASNESGVPLTRRRMDSTISSRSLARCPAHNPNRRTFGDVDELQKNLRRGADSRWYWQRTSRFFRVWDDITAAALQYILKQAARRASMPTLQIRGTASDTATDHGVQALRSLIPHVEVANVVGAEHMVVGDLNDVFAACVVSVPAPAPSGKD
ncbi:SDR family NAD(P)-dependent oxidoreductase [Nocardia sp. SC052]|uniref:SDR family NAD(P)-dependent oxidoreductase n=1 Tax=Nocardia sichangensis TaxID=3385975 RepID=UPI00399EFF31